MMFFVGLLGVAIGSFLNVLIDRIPKGEDIVWKPSYCDYCKKRLRWFELIPLISFIMQRRRCTRCRKRLSWQYPAVELATGIGFVLLYWHHPDSLLRLFAYSLILCCLLVLFVIDWKHMILPDSLLGMVLGTTIILGVFLPPSDRFTHVGSAVASGVLFLGLWAITRGRGLGFGDVKLVTVLGLLLGYPHTVIAWYAAFLTGAMWGVILMIRRHASMKSRIAFGPFLIAGAAGAIVWGDTIWRWWVRVSV
ncbi:MAG TPA: prepilin peptidase [Patescibacteria group bacterium]|nr:prepilin peptidase [Patescibacteria group bacterium]